MSKAKLTKKYQRFNHHHEITDEQEIVTIGGKTFVADKEMIELLTALNNRGLRTLSHCCGHETNESWVRISTHNLTSLEYRHRDKSLIIGWKRKSK